VQVLLLLCEYCVKLHLRIHRERITRLLWMFADEQREVGKMTHGNIAALVGLKNVLIQYLVTEVLVLFVNRLTVGMF